MGYTRLPGVTLKTLLHKGNVWANRCGCVCYRVLLPTETEIGFLAWDARWRGAWGPAKPGDWREGSRPRTGEGRLGYRLPFTFAQVRTGRLRHKVNAMGIKAQES